jgi:PAS domain-containing protein
VGNCGQLAPGNGPSVAIAKSTKHRAASCASTSVKGQHAKVQRLAFPADTPVLANRKLLASSDDGRRLAQAIVDTIREPLLVLDKDLRVIAANRSFYLTFKMNRQDVQDRPFHLLGEGEWNIPELRLLLKNIAPQQAGNGSLRSGAGLFWIGAARLAAECPQGVLSAFRTRFSWSWRISRIGGP